MKKISKAIMWLFIVLGIVSLAAFAFGYTHHVFTATVCAVMALFAWNETEEVGNGEYL